MIGGQACFESRGLPGIMFFPLGALVIMPSSLSLERRSMSPRAGELGFGLGFLVRRKNV